MQCFHFATSTFSFCLGLAIRIWSRNTCDFAFDQSIDFQFSRFVEEAPIVLAIVICVSSLIRFSTFSRHFGPIRSGHVFTSHDYHAYLAHYKSAFAFSDILSLQSISIPYGLLAVLLTALYRVTTFRYKSM